MKRRAFIQTMLTVPAVVPAMLKATPAPPVRWTEVGTSEGARLKLGHLTIIAGAPKSGKTRLLRKLTSTASAYDMPVIHRDLSFAVELDAVLEYMFGRGRYVPESAYVLTWPDNGMLAQLTLNVLEKCSLHYAGSVIPVIVTRLPDRHVV